MMSAIVASASAKYSICPLLAALPVLGQRASWKPPAFIAQRAHTGQAFFDLLIIRMLVHCHHFAARLAYVFDLHSIPQKGGPGADPSNCSEAPGLGNP